VRARPVSEVDEEIEEHGEVEKKIKSGGNQEGSITPCKGVGGIGRDIRGRVQPEFSGWEGGIGKRSQT